MATTSTAGPRTGGLPVISTPPDMEIPVTLRSTTLRRKGPDAVGVMTAGQLTQRYEIPRRDFRKRTGYQREVSPSRVNKTAKAVRTDLALDLLKQRAENDPRIMEALLESGQSWKVEAQAVAEEL